MTDDDRALIDFAAKQWRTPGAHAAAVRTELGLSVTRYWQRIGRLLTDPEALAYSPVVINRLRRIAGHG